jgi:beta-lactamase regulating signal transducer with metallopeptidase domain
MSEDIFLSHLPVGSFLFTLAWQSTLWLVLGLVVSRLLRRRAARGHIVLVLMSTAAILSPVSTLAVRHMDWGLLPARQSATDLSATPLPAATLPLVEQSHFASQQKVLAAPGSTLQAHVSNISDSQTFPISEWTSSTGGIGSAARFDEYVPAALAGCWLFASCVLTARLAVSLQAGRGIARAARVETSQALMTALRETARALGLRSRPDLRVSANAQCPMIWCWGSRPVLLVPESAAQSGGVNWRSVFCHELAHLVRRDHWSALGADVLVIALPWQPLAWRSRRRLAFLREQACDDWVLAAGGEAIDYAESLLQLVPQRSPIYTLAAVTNAESLKRRLRHVLAGARITPNAGRRWIAVAGLSALLGIVGLALAQQRSAAESSKGATNETVQTPVPAEGADGAKRTTHVAKESASERITARGQVFTPDGRPAAGAEVFACYHRYVTSVPTMVRLATTRTDAIGRYEIAFHKPHNAADVVRFGNPEIWKSMTCIFARQPGYGPDAARWNEVDTTKPVNLKLVPDVPILGRLVDLEGRPVSGATVELQSISGRSSDELRRFLKTVREGLYAAGVLTKTIPPDDRPRVTTNADGRFRIANVGRDRVVGLVFHGETIAYSAVTVVTKDIEPAEQRVHPDIDLTETRRVVGPRFTFSVPPTRVIAGVVRDASDRKPLAGVRITSDKFPGTQLSGVRTLSTKTDEEGRFQLVGMQKGSGAAIAVFPDGQPYFPRRIKVPDKLGSEPISLDIDLHRGIWITGRVTDKRDGSPQTARVAYFPLRTNSYAKQLSEFVDQELPDGPGNDLDKASGENGTYRILGVPGPALIGAWCPSGDYRMGVGFDDLKTVKPDRQGNLMSAVFSNGIPAPSRKWPNVVKEVTFPAETQAAVCDLTLDPGESVQISVLDANGKPATGYEVNGRTPSHYFAPPLQQSQFRVVGLAPGEKRNVLIHDAKRHIGKALTIEFGPRTPRSMTVQLERCATVVGRGVDGDGVPVAGVRLEPLVWPVENYATWLSGAAAGADGRFRHEGILPGVDYQLNVRLGFVPTVARSRLSVKPGETIDLGDVNVKRAE